MGRPRRGFGRPNNISMPSGRQPRPEKSLLIVAPGFSPYAPSKKDNWRP
jgi:hypothetical protein